MRYFIAMLVVFTGILFFQPVIAQEPDSVQEQNEQVVQHEQQTDKSVILLSKKRETPFSIMNLLRGLLGMAALISIGYLFSHNRKKIPWRTVFAGLAIQVSLAVGILYVPFVRVVFEFFGKVFVKILDFTKVGTEFLLGGLIDVDTYGVIFLFQVLPTIIFFSALMSLFFYWGIIQKIVWALAWVFTKTLKISGAESLSVAGNIFLGQTESPLMIKAYLPRLSNSEILLVMSGGMATLAGGVLAIYIAMLGGNDPALRLEFAKHLLAASVMAAPAAIIFSKMIVPPTEEINKEIKISRENIGNNVLDAITNGTSEGVKLAVNVAAMLLSFLALIAMFNYIIGKVGDWTQLNEVIANITNGQFDKLSLEFIMGYSFAPLMWLIGVCPEDMALVGRLLGEKLILTEFVGYISLADLKASGAFTQTKSIIMGTYLLCGFANFASIGIQIGGIGALAPSKRVLLSK
ncbi:MAG: nucleoside transporter C-terminal domain-containing protein, partial [Bacteroidota bacterium]